jgi:hypothetical protein
MTRLAVKLSESIYAYVVTPHDGQFSISLFAFDGRDYQPIHNFGTYQDKSRPQEIVDRLNARWGVSAKVVKKARAAMKRQRARKAVTNYFETKRIQKGLTIKRGQA